MTILFNIIDGTRVLFFGGLKQDCLVGLKAQACKLLITQDSEVNLCLK